MVKLVNISPLPVVLYFVCVCVRAHVLRTLCKLRVNTMVLLTLTSVLHKRVPELTHFQTAV